MREKLDFKKQKFKSKRSKASNKAVENIKNVKLGKQK